MQLGIHLPHAGEQATPALIRRHAIRAEALGFADVWVSEHIIVPRREFPRSPLFYDPVVTLSYVAAVTERVRLGTTVLVLPMRHPLPLAKELASLHNLSGGRLILGAGVGWLEPEFAALGMPFKERGRRMDEGIAMMRAVWTQDPVTFETKYIPAKIEDMTMLPLPISRIPLWIGGSSDAALKRTERIADGWHGSRETPEEAAPIVQRLRAARPGCGLHHLDADAVERQGSRGAARPDRGIRGRRRATSAHRAGEPRGRRLGRGDRGRGADGDGIGRWLDARARAVWAVGERWRISAAGYCIDDAWTRCFHFTVAAAETGGGTAGVDRQRG